MATIIARILEKNRRITNLRKLSLAGSYLTDVEQRDNTNCNRRNLTPRGEDSPRGILVNSQLVQHNTRSAQHNYYLASVMYSGAFQPDRQSGRIGQSAIAFGL